MDSIQGLINQQLGFGKWKSYDNILHRLCCNKNDEFKHILNQDDELMTPIFACKFAQKEGYEHIVALANEDGRIAVHNTLTNKDRYGIEAHHNAIFDLAWMFGQMKVVSVSGDHTARLFDISNCDIREESVFNAHLRSVKTVAFRRDDYSVFATGSRDGSILVWDTRTSPYSDIPNHVILPDRKICYSHCTPQTKKTKGKKFNTDMSAASSVTGLVFQDDHNLISCGAGDGIIKVWDMRKNFCLSKTSPVPKYSIPYKGSKTKSGFTNLLLDKGGMKLYASCLDNIIYSYNIATYDSNPIMQYKGHQNSTFYVKSCLSGDGQYLISGSSDQNAYIWNTKYSEPLLKLSGHHAEVTCVAWCQKGDTLIVTCSDDLKHKIWRIGGEILPENWEIDGRGIAEVITKRSAAFDQHKSKRMKTECSLKRCGSPVKQYKKLKLETSFRKLFLPIDPTIADNKCNLNFMPTGNLPNFIVDGCAPHLNVSPEKHRDKDWLTKIRIEKSFTNKMENLSAPSPCKMPKLDCASPTNRTEKMHRNESPQSPLLKFFKVTNSVLKCDSQQCSSKYIMQQQHQTS